MFTPLNPILHSELRLAIMNVLMSGKTVSFGIIKEETQASSGNLSIQLKKLEEAGLIDMKKTINGSYPQTSCKVNKKGIKAFEDYSNAIRSYLKIKK